MNQKGIVLLCLVYPSSDEKERVRMKLQEDVLAAKKDLEPNLTGLKYSAEHREGVEGLLSLSTCGTQIDKLSESNHLHTAPFHPLSTI